MTQITSNFLQDWKDKHAIKEPKPPFIGGLRTGYLRAWAFVAIKVLVLAAFFGGMNIMGKVEENISLLDRYVRNDFAVDESSLPIVGKHSTGNNLAVVGGGKVASAFDAMTQSNQTNYFLTGQVAGATTTDLGISRDLSDYINQAIQYNLASAIAARFILPGTGDRSDGCVQIDSYGVVTTRGSSCSLGGGGGGGSTTTTTTSMAMGDTINSATEGSILFAGTGGILAQDNSSFFWDNSTKRLGIGDATPQAALTVGAGDAFQVNSSGVIVAGTWNATALTDAYVSDTLSISNGGSVHWDALNNYPAACASGSAISELADTTNTCTAFNTDTDITLQDAYNAGNFITTTDGNNISITLDDTTTDQTFEITQVGTADIFRVNDEGTFADTTPFVIDANGNVGVGVVAPTEKLDVVGNIKNLASTDAQPVVKGTSSTGSTPKSVYVSGKYAYIVAQDSDRLEIQDISNPAAPALIGLVNTGTSPNSVFVAGRYAYVTADGADIEIYDISNKVSPMQVGTTTLCNSTCSAMYVSGSYAYGVDNSGRLGIVNISKPTAPVSVSITTPGFNVGSSIYIFGRYAYIADSDKNSLYIIDVTDPTSPSTMGSISLSNNPASVYVSGRYAYIVGASGDLNIIDISDPINPTLVSSTAFFESTSIFISGRYAYIGNRNSDALDIIDVGDPTTPIVVGQVGIAGSPNSVFVSGRYAYIVSNNQLEIVDIGGMENTSANIHSLQTGNLQVMNDIVSQGQLQVSGGISVGGSGITNAGGFSTLGTSYFQSNVGIGDTTPASLFTVGDGDLFQINSSGAIIAATGITSTGTITFSDLGGSGTRCVQVDNSGVFAVAGAACGSGGGSLTVGTTAISSGVSGRVLYDNSGTLGEMTTTGSGTVLALATSPTLVTPALGVATSTSLAIGGATLGSNALAVTGIATFSGDLQLSTDTSSLKLWNGSSYSKLAYGNVAGNNWYFGDAGTTNTGMSNNVGIGTRALSSLNNTGIFSSDNIGIGYQAGQSFTTALRNVAIGTNAMQALTATETSVAIGYAALNAVSGNSNVAIGALAMSAGSGAGTSNVAIGINAMRNCTSCNDSLGVGSNSLFHITTGSYNTGFGSGTLGNLVDGNRNVAIGRDAGSAITSGNDNIFIGYLTGASLSTGSNNTIIGGNVSGLSASLSNSIILATGAGSIQMQLGASDLGNGASISGPVITVGRNTNATNTAAGSINFQKRTGTAGYVWQDGNGDLRISTSAPLSGTDTSGGTVIGTQTSTRSTKQNINDYTDFTNALQMVADMPLHTFRYIKEVQNDPSQAKTRIGFIADEVPGIFMWGNSIDQVSVNGILMASVKALNNKIDVVSAQTSNQNNSSGNSEPPLPMGQPILANTPIVLQSHLYLSGDSVGEAKILAGAKSVRVNFAKSYQYQPIVTATPNSRVGSEYWVADKDSNGFTIYIDHDSNDDIIFDWHAFAGQAAKLTVSDGTIQAISLEVVSSPDSQPIPEPVPQPLPPTTEPTDLPAGNVAGTPDVVPAVTEPSPPETLPQP